MGNLNRRLPTATRVLALFLEWTALRALYTIYLGEADSEYRLATEAGFGPSVWAAEALYAFLATGAMVGIFLRWKKTVPLILAASAVSTSLLLFQLQQVEADPSRARDAYAASRRARDLPLAEERLNAMFSPSGRRFIWGAGAIFILGPLGLLLLRRKDFISSDEDED